MAAKKCFWPNLHRSHYAFLYDSHIAIPALTRSGPEAAEILQTGSVFLDSYSVPSENSGGPKHSEQKSLTLGIGW
eukprot:12887663-Alexandrium_andersonii.AAC.1